MDTLGRFFNKVDKTNSCWNWTASLDKDGYGQFSIGKKKVKPHRFSYELHKGAIPEGLCILHKCNNPKCVNPEHLYAGTNQDNINDKVNSGNSLYGEKNPRAKLCEKEALEIRALLSKGVKHKIVSELFNISLGVVYGIGKKVIWKHV